MQIAAGRMAAGCLAALATAGLALADEAVAYRTATQKLCVLAGLGDARAAGQEALEFYGTDMGITYQRGQSLEILFGDTWPRAEDLDPATMREQDDAYGAIDLDAFPDGDSVEAYCEDTGDAPPIVFGATSETDFAAQDPGIVMDGLKTPIIAFAAGREATSREFAVFVTGRPIACALDAECGGFTCDVGLGYIGEPPQDTGRGLTFACADGAPLCVDQTLPGDEPSGVCRDPGSSLAAPGDDASRTDSAVWPHLVGLRETSGERSRYAVTEWRTARFHNAIGVTVEDFDPARAEVAENDYETASGDAPAGDGVFIWGRPGWVSINSEGRNLNLYLVWAPVPEVGADGGFDWEPLYFTGLDAEQRPVFSADPLEAAPLDLSGEEAPEQEAYDAVGQMSVRWIASLDKWVMFYGGGFQAIPELCFALGVECDKVEQDGAAIRMRTADHPWGPWSRPEDVLVGGDPEAGPIAGSQYGPGGVLHHPECEGEDCAPSSTPPLPEDQPGWLYGPNIIEQWTEERPDGAVDLYWNVSSWNPYRVTLMKTRVSAGR